MHSKVLKIIKYEYETTINRNIEIFFPRIFRFVIKSLVLFSMLLFEISKAKAANVNPKSVAIKGRTSLMKAYWELSLLYSEIDRLRMPMINGSQCSNILSFLLRVEW